jgi:glycosyltransferase involved in cell wall biosynthesis
MNNSEQPLISIIITAGSHTIALGRTITSCVNQSYERVEILVVDYSREAMHANVHEDFSQHTLKYVHMPDVSVASVRNTGLAQAEGAFVLFVDGGNEVQEMWLEKAWYRINLSGADAAQCATVYERDNLTAKVHMPNDSLFGFYQRLVYEPTVPLNSMVVRRDICSQFPEDKPLAGDWEFWITTLKGKKIDVQAEYYGSIIHLPPEGEEIENSSDYLREKHDIMAKYYSELNFSIRKLKQFFKLRTGYKNKG